MDAVGEDATSIEGHVKVLQEQYRRTQPDCRQRLPGKDSQAKTVPSATAEEIQGLTSYPENFLFRSHRKCSDSVHLSVV